MKFVCEMCGKVYEDDNPKDLRKKIRVCSKECYRKRKNIQCRAYYYRQAEQKKEIKAAEEAKKPKRKKPALSMAQINEMAREKGLSYGQMQGVIYAQEHPLFGRG